MKLPALLPTFLLTCSVPLRAAVPADCWALSKHGHRSEAQACFDTLTRSGDAYFRAEGFWGLKEWEQSNEQFRLATQPSHSKALYKVRWGKLLHERFNDPDAAGLFREALAQDPSNAQAFLGLAIVSAASFDGQATVYLTKALELDPKLAEAHEFMADLALTNGDSETAAAEADKTIALENDALGAMAIHAAIELIADRPPDPWFARIQKINPAYGEAYAIVARQLELHYRYEDAVIYYRKAIEADPRFWAAHSALGIDLMRLGKEEEPFKKLELSYTNGYRDAATVNSLRLLDSYKNFATFRDATTILKLNKAEAPLLLPYIQPELHTILATYEKKYRMKLPGAVQVEVYPDHEDFAVRTTGMPGLGALGVTFGEVVAMDSPSARKPGEFNWGSTLWHEMSHVFILTATNHRVPRWFTEGLAVHEETEASPEWGDRMTPEIVVAIRDKKLLPVAQLDRGFIRPEYPAQVIVSYYQAGRICDYIKSRWGADKLLDMVHSYAQRKTTPEVIRQDLAMEPEEFDKQFLDWLDKDVGKTVANFDKWRTGLRDLAEKAKNKNFDEVLKEGEEVRRLYPDYVYPANPYEFMAQADLAKGNKQAATAILTDYEKMGGRNPQALKQLASLEEELGKPADAAATLERLNYIYPGDEDLHRHLGDLWLAQNNTKGAIREYGAVIALQPLDKASAQFNLARAYFAAGQKDMAEEHLLASLEAAPGFRPAQKLLLQLKDSNEGK